MTQPTLTRHARQRLQRRNRMVEAQQSLVGPIASHYAHCSPEGHDDLKQVGLLGLIRAAELYNQDSQVPFSAYARQHIRGAILHYLRDHAELVRHPRRHQELRIRARRVEERLQQQLGRWPSSQELRLALGLSDRQWGQLQAPDPWQERVREPGVLERCACASDDESDRSMNAALALQALQALEPAQRQVVEQVVLKGESLRQVASRQGCSASTMHRLLHRALSELRQSLDQLSLSAI